MLRVHSHDDLSKAISRLNLNILASMHIFNFLHALCELRSIDQTGTAFMCILLVSALRL